MGKWRVSASRSRSPHACQLGRWNAEGSDSDSSSSYSSSSASAVSNRWEPTIVLAVGCTETVISCFYRHQTPDLNKKCNRCRTADLSFANLAAIKSSTVQEEQSWSTFAENGKSQKRIRDVLRSRESSDCTCTRES